MSARVKLLSASGVLYLPALVGDFPLNSRRTCVRSERLGIARPATHQFADPTSIATGVRKGEHHFARKGSVQNTFSDCCEPPCFQIQLQRDKVTVPLNGM